MAYNYGDPFLFTKYVRVKIFNTLFQMVNLITILSFNVKLSHAQFLYDLQAEVLRLPPKISLRYAQLG